ncbi:MAG: hypothetical protein ABI947_06575, partial [Chloroflexota bacterium]
LALILICLGGGFGWLLILLGQSNLFGSLPIDTILPEGYTFYLLYGLPHLALARIGLLSGLLFTFHALTLKSRWMPTMIFAGLCWLVMALCVPFYIGVLYAILGVWGLAALLRYRRFPTALFVRCVVGALVPFPYFVYNLYIFAANPVLKAWAVQNTLPSPNPIHYVFGYGLLAVLALPAIRWAWQRGLHRTPYLLLPAWVIAAPVLAYLPISVQRRLLEAIFVPLCILAVMGLRLWWMGSGVRRYPRRAKLVWREAVIGVIMLLLPTSLLLLVGGVTAPSQAGLSDNLFHTSREIAALDWLNTHSVPDSVVLSTLETGNYLPAQASLRTYIGHSPETINLDAKRDLATRFFEGKLTETEQRSLFDDNRIRYVIYDPGVPPIDSPDLISIYSGDQGDRGGYAIYEVRQR